MQELVGRYQVQERIGEGAMADVYRAYDPGINRVLAIKVLKGEFRRNPQYAARFLREAKAAGALSHPNIVTIYDVGEVDGYPYIAMELLDGEPLDKVCARAGKLPVEDVLAVGVQLAEALRYAHEQGVVHRDIKPSNIMLGKDGRTIKILDFGIARVAESEIAVEDATLRTQIGQVVGTPRYMSPEQALGQDLDGRSDLFSTGVVLYELITGRRAFSGSSAATLALQITQQEPAPIVEFAPDAPRGVQFVLSKLLAKRPDRRFEDGGQLAEALRRELSVYQTVVDEGRGARRALPLQARLTLMIAGITAVVLLLSAWTVQDRQYKAMERMALTSGSAVASFVASNVALQAADNATLPADQRDWMPVEAFVKAAASDPNIQQITVVDADNIIRGASDPALIGQIYEAAKGEAVIERKPDATVTASETAKGPGLRFVRPITYAGREFGRVDVSLSKADLTEAANLTKLLLGALGAVVLGVVAVSSFTVARLMAQPIRRLKSALAEAADGRLDFRISHRRRDEFGELFDHFNHFAQSMEERLQQAEARGAVKPVRAPSPAATPTGPFAPPPTAVAAVDQALNRVERLEADEVTLLSLDPDADEADEYTILKLPR